MISAEHIKANLVGYLLPVAAMLMWAGFTFFMDQRHDAAGSAEHVEHTMTQGMLKQEMRSLKREKRKLEGYQRLSPNSEYFSARESEISALKDEIEEIQMEIK